VTLHVGPGTFQPLRSEILSENRLEPEEYHVPAESLASIRKARSEGGRIVAVGTTTTRILETIDTGSETSLSGETEIFIFPPYRFRNVDALITNFHLPESSLLCLVAAFMGYDRMMEAYRHAISGSYRFYSYGDAMLIGKGVAG
ncbi:MAG: S-adenosylmethionine:tRNA ribosyltransferase-isomerase, partial [Candidatus Fermentibacteraceae bacterium]|nr:S-adenosylmethionine:tRNA ribosyltransferase-isomerase [Candidatus Fermentibacteraceae bacterium]